MSNTSEKEMTIEEAIEFIDAWADEEFAEENGITVEEIPAYIAKMKEQDDEQAI